MMAFSKQKGRKATKEETKELTPRREATKVLEEIVYPVIKKSVRKIQRQGYRSRVKGIHKGIHKGIYKGNGIYEGTFKRMFKKGTFKTMFCPLFGHVILQVKPKTESPITVYRPGSELAFWYKKGGKIEVRQIIRTEVGKKQPEPQHTSFALPFSEINEEWVKQKASAFFESVLKAH